MNDTELATAEFAPPIWAVQGVIPIGVTLLAAKPKDGKSWWALECAMAVADGRPALGAFQTVMGDVLYFALEDNLRRMQRRMRKIDPKRRANGNLDIECAVNKFDEGGEKTLKDWLIDHPKARMVVIDNLRRFAPVNGGYSKESATIQALNDFALKHQIAMLVVMHMYKGPGVSATSPDWTDKIQGGVGVTGAAECILGIARSRNSNAGVLRLTGKDIEDDSPIPMIFDKGKWIAGASDDPTIGMTEQRKDVYRVVEAEPGLEAKEVTARLPGSTHNNVRQILYQCVQAGLLVRPESGTHKGQYYTAVAFERLGQTDQTTMLTPGGQLTVTTPKPVATATK